MDGRKTSKRIGVDASKHHPGANSSAASNHRIYANKLIRKIETISYMEIENHLRTILNYIHTLNQLFDDKIANSDGETKENYIDYKKDLRDMAVVLSTISTKMTMDGILDPKFEGEIGKLKVRLKEVE